MDEKHIVKDRLDQIRKPERCSVRSAVVSALLIFAAGVVLGVFSKWLDDIALDSTIWWHRPLEILDLGNFFSDFAIWLLIALIIAVFSPSPIRAALNVFVFFMGMCAAYHICTVLFSGFDPSSYMMIWYGITLLSPLLAVLCWYAKGNGTVPVILDIAIIAVFALSCFSIGWLYIIPRGILYLLVFGAAVAVLYRDPRQMLISLAAGFLAAIIISPNWPYL